MKNDVVDEINEALTKKFLEWVTSIEDENLRTLVKDNTIITGGAITSLLLNEKIKDYDIYFSSKEVALAVAIYYVTKFNASNRSRRFLVVDGDNHPYTGSMAKWKRKLIEAVLPGMVRIISLQKPKKNYDPDDDYSRDLDQEVPDLELDYDFDVDRSDYYPRFLSHNAVTLTDKMQLITRFYGSPDEIHENFDFVHCTNYWESNTGQLHLRPEALDAIEARELRYIGSKFPLCSALRVDKFKARGWEIPDEEWAKIAKQIMALDLEDSAKLKEQLAGYYSTTIMEMSKEIVDLKLESGNETSVNDILDIIKTYF